MPALSGGKIWLYRRLAKSVACSRLNVSGVRTFVFFPRRVVSLTSSEEFHSVKKMLYPWDSSHLRSRLSCVLLPEPSMPSTTVSLPGQGCGTVNGALAGVVMGRLPRARSLSSLGWIVGVAEHGGPCGRVLARAPAPAGRW